MAYLNQENIVLHHNRKDKRVVDYFINNCGRLQVTINLPDEFKGKKIQLQVNPL